MIRSTSSSVISSLVRSYSFRRSRGLVCCDRLHVLDRAAVLKVGRDPDRAKRVATDVRRQPGLLRLPLDHPQRVVARHLARSQLAAPSDSAEEGSFHIRADGGAGQVRVEIFNGVVMGRDLVILAAFFVESEPAPFAPLGLVFDAHSDGGAHPCERERHEGDQRAVAQARDIRRVDAVE